ncbi:sodium channel modifier 1-like, partial [Cyanistes caeruleus]|uniref:sodium channel modifier 1-like n=1 Tax=Cyanistes caeruleus TaxID=156563 RepID=UPI000CDA55C4
DEALLLRDGRLACSLCPHRPVCDTLETLLLHRAGRKHLDSLHRCYSRPRCPQVSPQGPQVTPQEAPGVALALQAPLLARTRRIARSALLSSAPYNSRCRKQPTKSSSSRVGTIPKNSQRAPEPLGNPGNPENPENPENPQAEGVAKGRKAGRKGNSRNSEGPKGNSRNSEGPKGNSRNSENPERLRILRHHLHLRSRGWLQDPAGNWIKDDNVEFDSDEEEPPPLPPA